MVDEIRRGSRGVWGVGGGSAGACKEEVRRMVEDVDDEDATG